MKDRKIAVLVGDGMADTPQESLGSKTPLEVARTPNMDYLAGKGIIGMVRTVPPGMAPGSDTANLSIFGYDPVKNYTGRAPLEAVNLGINLGPKDVAFRCNLVEIDENDVMKDFSAGHVESELSKVVVGEIAAEVSSRDLEFYPGVSYRNILVWRNYPYGELTETTPPHDIQGLKIRDYLPSGPGAELLREVIDISRRVIGNSAVVRDALNAYHGKPTSAWFWGAGKMPRMATLRERFGLHGYTISAVDLIHGIGRLAGLEPLPVEGATGYIDTNYTAKASALFEAMETSNFVFLHVESPDESGHEGNAEHKIRAIEDFDEKIVGPVMDGLRRYDDYSILVMPDHPTPIDIKTHTSEPVPFCIFSPQGLKTENYNAGSVRGFTEKDARNSGLFIEEGFRLLEIIINRSFI